MGWCIQAVISKKDEFASHGMGANSDPSEGTFATFMDIVCNACHINLGSVAGNGQNQYYSGFACDWKTNQTKNHQ